MFETETFGQVGQIVLDQLNIYFSKVGDMGARPYVTPKQMLEVAREFLDQPKTDDRVKRATRMSEIFLEHVYRLHSPKSLGHQVAPSIPVSSAFEFLASSTNASCGIFEMGPLLNGIERALIEKLNQVIGWDQTSDGIVTSGGSLANMTAILAARNSRLKGSWRTGVSPGSKIITGSDTHYSVSRGAGIVGVGTDHILKAPLDSKRKVDCDRLRDLLKKNYGKVFALVGSACATPIGAFDPLEDMAALAREFDLWFHVDGAHGASLALSRKYKHVLSGIQNADSITWDAHKMMFVPSLCTFLLYKRKTDSYSTFEQDAPYLLSNQDPQDADFDSARRTVECTKRSLAIGVWSLWSLYGTAYIESMIDATIGTTRMFYELLEGQDDFKTLHEPECNILCFRYEPAKTKGWSEAQLSDFQVEVRNEVLKKGEFYITGTMLDGIYSLRVTIMNPKTGPTHLEHLLTHIREVAP
jgi:L-2,4-diaminobutyrate decarboxylase